MSSPRFLARVGPDAGRREGVERLRGILGDRDEVAMAFVPGLELAWRGPCTSNPPASSRTLCLITGWAGGLEALAGDLGVDGNDAEILAHGYERFGDSVLRRIRGSFAVLLWDQEARSGLVARDQLGGRSVYFQATGPEQLIGSEVRDLIAAARSKPDPDQKALAHWLARRPPPAGRTMFAGISRLPAGRLIRAGAAAVEVERWWEPVYREPRAIGREEAIAELRETMARAVARVLRPATSPGVMLSGGLDSACVAGLARDLGIAPPAYSGVFPAHREVDESHRISKVRDYLGLEAREMAFTGGSALEAAAEYTRTWALPPSSPNWFVWEPLYAMARADGVDVMLDGEGGDELFGCSPRLLADLLTTGRLRELGRQARRVPGMGETPQSRWVRRAVSEYALRGALPPGLHTRARRLRSRGRHDAPWLSTDAQLLLEADTDRDAWKRFKGPRWWAWLAFALVDGPDRMAAQDEGSHAGGPNGFQVAHPWRDLELVEFVLSLPPELAFDPIYDRPLARAAVRGLIPDEVRLSQEKPFFNRVLDEALGGADAPELARLLDHPPETVAWALRPGALGEVEGPARSLAAWRVATANLWAREIFE